MQNPLVKTLVLFGALTALLAVLGYVIGGPRIAISFFAFSLVMNIFTYWFSDKIALSMSGGQPLAENQIPGLLEDVRDLCQGMGIPMPKVYISPQPQPNAFATGRNPKNSTICITQGLVQSLNREEIKGVIAHELAHIKNRDVLTATIAAVIAGAVSALANIGLLFGGNDDEEKNPAVTLLLIILAPIAAFLIQMAISRQREFAADEAAGRSTGNPQALANALVKINSIAQQVPMNINPALSSLYIANPLRGNGFMELFSTHPPVEKRVERLLTIRI
jgi:heat shock protein HtpX